VRSYLDGVEALDCDLLGGDGIHTFSARGGFGGWGSLARAVAAEAIEHDHHGRPSFRVGGKIFATLWSEQRMNVMLDEGGILTAVGDAPETCSEVWWGKRLAAVAVDLGRVDAEFLAELLRDAWEQRAPNRLVDGRSRQIAGALFFGLGFGRDLQLMHMRAGQIELPPRRTDFALYAAVLLGLYG
jgi:hypothetical protein